ncbi:hypothetical protein [Bacillus methanolicus]|uniref:hypothetical protein n=1 Tax=Bacillus methanolicus TaxID=1471 RepID=UPI002010B51D|nr:hypothetical protein [Bacillus methanolicus]
MEIHYNRASGFIDPNFWLDNLLPNIIADMISIIFTSFVIAGLFTRHQKKIEEKRLYIILGRDFERLINVLSRNYLYLLKRDEDFLTFLIDDKKVKTELKNIVIDRDSFFNFSMFNSTFRVWNINEGSSIYDSFVGMIDQIEKHEKITWSYLEELNELFLKKQKMEFELNGMDKDSEIYKLRLAEYKQISDELSNKVRIKIPIDEKFLDVAMSDVLNGYIKFFSSKIEGFFDKYTFIVPMDIRLSLAEIEKTLSFISANLYWHNHRLPGKSILSGYNSIDEYRDIKKKEILDSIEFIAEEFLNLSGYFKNIK